MTTQFVEQVQLLMQAQQIKCAESMFENSSNYYWLRKRKVTLLWMSPKNEFSIRQQLSKLNEEQKQKAIKQLLKWMDENPHEDSLKIPEMCISLLKNAHTEAILNNLTFSRMASFRNSLRRFSTISNKIAPVNLIPPTENAPRRSVTFNDVPTIYSITNK